MSAPPVLLEINRAEWKHQFNLAQAGDEDARRAFVELWAGHTDIHCFLCDAAVPSEACHSEPIPHRDRPDLILAAPLCADCRGLTTQQRLHRINKMLGAMWKTKKGSPMRFLFHMPWNR